MNKEESSFLQVRLSKKDKEEFKKLAAKNNRNPSILVRDYIMAYLSSNGDVDLKSKLSNEVH